MTEPLLFTPLSIRDVTFRNRVVVPPMHQYSATRGFPTEWHMVNAGKFAAGGAGLVIVESTKVERRGCGTIGDLGLWDDAFVAPLKRITDFIRKQAEPDYREDVAVAPARPSSLPAMPPVSTSTNGRSGSRRHTP